VRLNCPFNSGVCGRFSFRNQMQGCIKGRVGRNMSWDQYSFHAYVTVELNIPSVYGLIDTNGKTRVELGSNNIAVAIN